MKPFLSYGLTTAWIAVLLLLLIALLTPLEITNGLVLKGIVFMLITGCARLAMAAKAWPLGKTILASTGVFGVFLILHFLVGPPSKWKTQTILCQNNQQNRTIEFQLQGKGARGYNRRTIDRRQLLPFVSWVKELTDESLKSLDPDTWQKVDIHLNEQGLKGG